MKQITFWVDGSPIPQGSMKAMVSKTTGKAFVKQSAPLMEWRKAVRFAWWDAAAREQVPAHAERTDRNWPVMVIVEFAFPRPGGHYTSKGKLKSAAPLHKTTAPDIDKLSRAVLDALTGLAYWDDSQVVMLEARKRYTDTETNTHEMPNAMVSVRYVDDEEV